MLDYVLTALVILLLAAIALWGSKKDESGTSFFSKRYTTTLKGLSAIIVMMVHVPLNYQNTLQDAVGSFAYVAVTLFFMISAFGMHVSMENKTDYLRFFWRNRLSSLLVPVLVVNLVFFFILLILSVSGTGVSMPVLKSIVSIDSYVVVLLEYCLLFFVVFLLLGKKPVIARWLVIAGVVISSLLLYFLNPDAEDSSQMGWPYERIGLVWGLLLAVFWEPICKFLNNNRIIKAAIVASVCLAAGLAYLKFKSAFFWGGYLLKVFLGLSIIVFLFLLTQKRSFGNRVSDFLGKISYEIYLSHGTVFMLVLQLFPTLSSGTFILISIGMTVFLSYMIHLIDAPIVKFLRK